MGRLEIGHSPSGGTAQLHEGLYRRLVAREREVAADAPAHGLVSHVIDGEGVRGVICDPPDEEDAIPLDVLVDAHFHARILAREPGERIAEPSDDCVEHGFSYRYSAAIRRKGSATIGLVDGRNGGVLAEKRVEFDPT